MKVELKLDTCYINKGKGLQYHTLTYVETVLFGQVLLAEEFHRKWNSKEIAIFDKFHGDDWREMPKENFGMPFDKLDEEGQCL